ncbi:Ger(x)C family spore germination C-terminal domain-containing protein [Cohnella faecalis]|uniref:Ger(X)C family spore germination protein n=1 Tax=Cohnella faecalis TaxID=2315694 RepID=A0A398CN83_9BACL|nr:Ger(x)C family spore germination C-terminal domain-containing protein [Cohnella faecalis]RIE04816.1 hypothetical protein D3H35_04930 [Cohnella faecalis]
MREKLRRILLSGVCLVILSTMLSACWDEVTIQDVNYVTALGVDYDAQSEQFTLYVQLIDMSTVAKSEANSATSNAPASFTGIAKGHTVYLAMQDLLNTIQEPPSLEQLMAVIVNERALSQMSDILDALNRNRAVRYTTQLTATDIDIPELFNADRYFNKSPLMNVYYNPGYNVEKRPHSPIADVQHFVREYRNPTLTALIPRMVMSDKHWLAEGKPARFPYVEGAYAFKKGKWIGEIKDEEIRGMKWFKASMLQSTIPIMKDGSYAASLSVISNKGQIKYVPGVNGGSYVFTLNVQSVVKEQMEKLGMRQMMQLAEKAVKDDLQRSIQYSAKKGIDLYNVEEQAYRYHHKSWVKAKAEGIEFERLPVKMIVNVKIMSTGKLK